MSSDANHSLSTPPSGQVFQVMSNVAQPASHPSQTQSGPNLAMQEIRSMFSQHADSVRQEIRDIRAEFMQLASATPSNETAHQQSIPVLVPPPQVRAENANRLPPTLSPCGEEAPRKREEGLVTAIQAK